MRNTPLLKAVTKIFKAQARPLSVPELQVFLKAENLLPNKTSLYRLLEKLQEAQSVKAVLLDNKAVYYEWEKSHHPHFTCTSCAAVKCLQGPELKAKIQDLKATLQQKGLFVQSHHFSFSGHCADCAK